MSRMANGMRVSGALVAGKAALRLVMFREADCSTIYSCEVRTSDGQGNELVQTNRLRQQPKQSRGLVSGDLMTSGVMLQQLALLQRYMTAVGASMDGKLAKLETRLDRKIGAFGSKLEVSDDKFKALDSKSGVLEGEPGASDGEPGASNSESGTSDDEFGALGGESWTLNGDLGALGGDLGVLDGDLGVLDGDLGVLDGDLGVLGGDLGVLGGELKALDDNFATLNGKLKAMGSKLETFGSRFENLETLIVDMQVSLKAITLFETNQTKNETGTPTDGKLLGLENKLSVLDTASITKRLDGIEGSLTRLEKEVMDDNRKTLKTLKTLKPNTVAISNSTIEVLNTMQGQMTEILAQGQRTKQRLNELMDAKEKIINSSDNLNQRVQSDISELHSNLRKDFEELKLNMQNSSTETLAAVRDLTEIDNHYGSKNASSNEKSSDFPVWSCLKPIVADIVNPKECRKGMYPSLVGTAYPYLVIQPNEKSELEVPYLCDSLTDGGGWVVIQRRFSGKVDFYRNWEAYREGFGSVDNEFWLGNKYIYALTNSGTYELRIEIQSNGMRRYAHYNSFYIMGENYNYVLKLGSYVGGTVRDSLRQHNNKPFSTYDRDHDGESGFNCAREYSGAWWYYDNYYSNLNGRWHLEDSYRAAYWYYWTDYDAVTFSEMKIRKL